MDNLPTPLSRIELYLGAAAGMTGVTMPDEPMSRLEQYLAFIAGDTSVELPTPASLCEQWLAYVAGIAPIETLEIEGAFHIGAQKVDVRFFAAAAGMPGVLAPEPQNRTEQYWARLAEILPVHGTLKYETGTSITLTDVAWWRMRLERINGGTTQQTYTGKNLLSITGETSGGVTGTMNPDGTFTIAGKATVTDDVRLGVNVDASLPAGTYTFTIGAARTSVTNLVLSDEGTNTSFRITAGNTSATATTAYTATKIALFIAVTNGVTYDETFSLQLVSGSTADYDFEPYVGGIPSPNPDYPQAINTVTGEQTVTVASCNLISGTADFSGEWERSTYWDTEPETYNGLVVKSRSAAWNGIYKSFSVKSGETYTFSVFAKAGSNRTSRIYLGNPGSADITSPTRLDISITTEWQRFSVTFTTTADGVIAPRVENTAAQSTPTYICGYQLQTGSSATDFQPYQKTNYTLDLSAGSTTNLYNKDLAYKYNQDAHLDVTLKPNTTYIFNTGKAWTGVSLYDSTGTQTRKVGNDASLTHNISFTTASNEVKGTLTFYIGSADIKTYDFTGIEFFEAGIELCKIGSNQDYIYRDGNNWLLHKQIGYIRLYKTQGWLGASGAYYSLPKTDPELSAFALANYSNLVALCTHFTKNGWDANTFGLFYSGSSNLNFNWDNSHTNVNAFKTWLTNNEVYLYLKFATATDTKITNPTLIAQLNALDRAVLPKPVAYITASGDLPGELKISYYGEDE